MKIGLFIISLCCSLAQARPVYFNSLMAAYPEARLNSTTKCQTCHGGGSGLNFYGRDFSSQVKTFKPLDFTRIDELDSDGDGVSNREEILSGTNPGVASGH